MNKWIKRAFVTLLLLGAVLVGGYYWYFVENSMPESGEYGLNMQKIRELADAEQGAKASGIDYELVANAAVPQIFMAAGTDWTTTDLMHSVFRVSFPETSIIIDTALDKANAEVMDAELFDADAYDRAQTAMEAASYIVVSHEHMDHIGGLLTSPKWKALLPKALITQEQFETTSMTEPVQWPEGSRTTFKPLQYDDYKVIAPGVVLIKAAGHTPGSQLVYVQREDGKEFLFVGDVASLEANISLQKGRSRLIDDVFVGSDRNTNLLQLKALKQLMADNPEMVIVPGHDLKWLNGLVAAGHIKKGFSE